MPYIHPDLGVPCITAMEFWNLEGEREGKPGGEVMQEFYAQMAEEDELARSELMSNRDAMMDKLKEYYSPEYCESDWQPTEIVAVEDADVHTSMRSCSSKFTVKVKCSDNKVRKLHYIETHYSGSHMEPPDYDCNCVELTD